MMPEDVPQDDWLRDALYKKIRNSNLMVYDIKQYESWMEGDPRRTYQYLINVIERHIARIREDKHVAAREKYARDFAGGGRPTAPTPTAPAPPDANAKAKAKANAKEKAAPKPKAKSEAAPVLPSPQPKQHAKGKGQGRKGKSKSRSASPREKKKIPCRFHFIKKSCKKGKDCEYSHDQKTFDASKNGGHGKGGGKTPRGQSPANKTKKIDEPCWHWAKGKCRYGDKCNKRHDAHLFNTAPNTESPSSKAAPALLHDDSDVDEPPFMIASNVVKKKVKFSPQKDEVHVYEKKDYVKSSRKSQTYSKGHNKLGRTTDEVRKDEQWAYSCRLARSRGKAMAIILDEKYDYSDIDEVLIIVGPTLDIMIRMEYEDDDVTREVFTENYVQHIDGRYGKRDNIMCITVPVEERDKRFIMDSGSGHDLISAKKVDRMDLPTYDDAVVNFHTANGVTSSTKRSDIKFEAFDEPAQAHILEDTPSVMSMGKRCVDLGYSFIWPSGKTPYMIDPNGDIIEMTVRDYIPYINIDQKKKKGTSSKIAKILNIISDECSTSEGENMMVIDGESGDELEDLTDIVRRSDSKSSKKAKVRKVKRKRDKTLPEVAVGSDPDYVEELASYDDEPDDRGDEYAEFDDDDGYEPSLGPDAEEGEHDVEIEEIPEGEAREDDDDVIDVDEEDGGVRLSKRGTLKNEARSKLHLLTHRYKNPYCESCVRAKMKHRKTFRGAFQRKLTKFGDLITFDYVDNRRIAEQDYGDDKTIFVIRDRYTGMLQSYPSARKDTDAVIRAVKQFMGRRKIREAYSDDAPQFDKAMKALKIPMDTSLAGKTKHNSLAERTNQFVLVATTTCLLEAGIPPCFWMYAIRCVSHLLNIEPNDDEVSSWCKLHGEEFKGKMIPFGALVYFKPSDARAREQQHKFDPMGIPGIFAGYSLGPGLH